MRTRQNHLALAFIALLLFTCTLASAAVYVETKDGKKYIGDVVREKSNAKEVTIKTIQNKTVVIQRKNIKRMRSVRIKNSGNTQAPQYKSIPLQTITVEQDTKVKEAIDALLQLPDATARKAAYDKWPQDIKTNSPELATMENWLKTSRFYAGHEGKTKQVVLPWQGKNKRAVAIIGIPKSYDPKKKAYPLIFALHGTEDNPKAIASIMAGVIKHDCILVAPRTTQRAYWHQASEVQNIFHLIGHMATHYRIDPRRIVMSGGSGGGMGTWAIATKYPNLFAAAGSFSGMPPVPVSAVKELKHVPIYVLHGDKDHIPVTGPRKMVAELKRLNFEHIYVEYDGDHFPSQKELKKFREWLQNPPAKPNLSPRPTVLKFIKEAAKAKPMAAQAEPKKRKK